ncbi:hypothetical protein PG987_000264 [Apiospora arundinis]
MEPLTALGLAANVAQFLGYGIKLIATAKEVHNSSEGVTQQISILDTVYGKLGTLSSVLRLPSQPPGKMGWDAVTYETAIQDIARVCQDDCDKLLELTKQLKRSGRHSSRFSSLKIALKTMRKSNQINELEQRLHRTQQTLTLQICSLTSSLRQHPRWDEVNQEAARSVSLVDRVTERSAGVFLWVYLTTRELRSGLSEYDSFAELEQRLETIPGDLGVFFRQILETVDPFHHQAMAEALLLSLAVREPAPISVYYYLDKDRIDPEYVLKLPLRPWSTEETLSNHLFTDRRLNARCRGLLQVNTSRSRVEPLHRTVLDYLCTQEQLEERSGVFQLLEHLETSIPEMDRNLQLSFLAPGDPPDPDPLFLRDYVIQMGLAGYMDYMVCRNPGHLSTFAPSVMEQVVDVFGPRGLSSIRRFIPLAKVLIKHKLDMNEALSVHDDPPWILVLVYVLAKHESAPDILNAVLESDLIHLMLRNGANPYLLLYKRPGENGVLLSHDKKLSVELGETLSQKLWLSYFVSCLIDTWLTAKAMAGAIRILDQTFEVFTTLLSFEGNGGDKIAL